MNSCPLNYRQDPKLQTCWHARQRRLTSYNVWQVIETLYHNNDNWSRPSIKCPSGVKDRGGGEDKPTPGHERVRRKKGHHQKTNIISAKRSWRRGDRLGQQSDLIDTHWCVKDSLLIVNLVDYCVSIHGRISKQREREQDGRFRWRLVAVIQHHHHAC